MAPGAKEKEVLSQKGREFENHWTVFRALKDTWVWVWVCEDTLPQAAQWGLPEDQGKEEEDQVGASLDGSGLRSQLRDSGRKIIDSRPAWIK